MPKSEMLLQMETLKAETELRRQRKILRSLQVPPVLVMSKRQLRHARKGKKWHRKRNQRKARIAARR